MKKVLVSGIIALAIIIGAVVYSQNRQQQLNQFEVKATEVIALADKTFTYPSVAVRTESPNIEASIDHDYASPHIHDANTHITATLDEKCCPEDDLYVESFDDYILEYESSEPIVRKRKLPPYEWLRNNLINQFGDSLHIDLYIDLLRKQRDQEPMSFHQFLTYTQLNAKYNPSADSRRLRDINQWC